MRRPGYFASAAVWSGAVLTTRYRVHDLDCIAWSNDATADHAGHLTSATQQRFQRLVVDLEQLFASRPVAGDLELGVRADSEARPLFQSGDGDALDGQVLAEDARADGHALLCELLYCFQLEQADL